jgi:hypothetical protein
LQASRKSVLCVRNVISEDIRALVGGGDFERSPETHSGRILEKCMFCIRNVQVRKKQFVWREPRKTTESKISFSLLQIFNFGLFSGPKPPEKAFSDENLRFVKEIRNFQHDSPSCFFWEEGKFLQ